jgi:hypothetical protein
MFAPFFDHTTRLADNSSLQCAASRTVEPHAEGISLPRNHRPKTFVQASPVASSRFIQAEKDFA